MPRLPKGQARQVSHDAFALVEIFNSLRQYTSFFWQTNNLAIRDFLASLKFPPKIHTSL